MSTPDTERAYEIFLWLVEQDDDARELLALIRDGVDEDALLSRWAAEHETNGAGRVEARVFEEDGRWVAEPKVGFQPRREFGTELAAREWIRLGGHYVHPKTVDLPDTAQEG